MRLTDLVTTSGRVAETRSRSEKTGALADLLRRLSPEEIDVAVAWLSGNLRQGRIGLGGAAVRDSRPGTAAGEPTLTLGEVDSTFERIASTTGAGSTAARVEMLRELLARATGEEQDFLIRLIFGELRQGARRSCSPASCRPSPGPCSARGGAGSTASASSCCVPFSPCSPPPRRTSPRPWSGSARPPSS